MTTTRHRNTIAAGAAAFAVLAALSSAPSQAGFKMCAFRDGPRGPCTCKGDTDGPGQFTVVPASRCRGTPAKKPDGTETGAVETDGTPAAATEPAGAATTAPAAAAAPETVPQETAANPSAATAAPPAPAPSAAQAATAAQVHSASARLAAIRARGKLLCGVNTGLVGFAATSESGSWSGFDVDFCRAVAAAIFADPGKIEFVPVETADRFTALESGKIDILSRNTTWTMSRETDLGVRFAGIIYFDGQGFITKDQGGLVSAQQLAGSAVCVEAGTTSEKNVAHYFKTQNIEAEIKAMPTREAMLKAYAEGACEAYSGDRSALFSDRAASGDPLTHAILPEVISKEPLGPAMMAGDTAFEDTVRWTLAGLINAEEVGLDKAAASGSGALTGEALRLVEGAGASGEKLGLSKTWLRDAVAAVGNYGEMFETNLGKAGPLGMDRGMNALWKRGGILYAPPMW